MNRRYATLFERLIANTRFNEETGCWEWTARVDRNGYAMISVRVPGRPHPIGKRAHRVMAVVLLGRELDPDEETIDHECLTVACINPWHLRIATRSSNSADPRHRRGTKQGRPVIFRWLLDREVWGEPDPYLGIVLPVRPTISVEAPF